MPNVVPGPAEQTLPQPASVLSSSWIWLLILFCFGSFIETVFFGQLGAFTPRHLPELGVPIKDVARWTGIIASLSGLLGLPFLPLWGALADRYSRKPIIIRSFAVEMVAGIAALLAGNIGFFTAARTFASLALGNSGLMLATLAERAPSNRQSLAFSIQNAAGPVGIFIGPLIGGPIVDHWGFRTLVGIDALLLLVVVVSLSVGYRDRFTGTNRGPLLSMAGDSIRIILKSPRLRALFPALFVLFAGWMMALTYAPLAIDQVSQGSSATTIGVILGAGGLVALGVSPLLGWLADRYGTWRVLLAGAGLAALLWILPALARSQTSFGIAWAAVNGVSSGVFAISFSALAQSTEPEVRGRVMSFAYLPTNLGLFLGPGIGALITHTSVLNVFPAAAV
ncbi:MAG TPA: MFS transporter, partial [Anaerolineaceae bacterium]